MEKKKVLCVASKGGHWVELLRITTPLHQDYEVVYMSTHEKYANMVPGQEFFLMRDFSRWDAWKLIPEIFSQLRIQRKVKPYAVVSTGAAPGLISLFVAKLRGCKTIWIDSAASVEKPSASGRVAALFVDHAYTQWQELANDKFKYAGNIFG